MTVDFCIGGLWTYYIFDARLEIQNAEAQLQKLNNELIQRPIIITSMDYSVKKDETRKAWFIIVYIEVENKGNLNAQIGIAKESLRVAKVVMKNGVISDFKNRIHTEVKVIPGINEEKSAYGFVGASSLLAGQVKYLQYAVEVTEAGLYQIEFHGKLGDSIADARGESEFNYPKKFLGTLEFILIK